MHGLRLTGGLQLMPIPNTNKVKLPRLCYGRVEAAEILGIDPATVDRLAKRGLLRPSRATRRPLYPLWEIERFLRDTTTADWQLRVNSPRQ
jgi:hypothetical protein